MAIIKQLRGTDSGEQVHALGDKEYKFSPNDSGDLVCEVKNPTHVKQFLSHEDDFAQVGGSTADTVPDVNKMNKPQLVEHALKEHGIELDMADTAAIMKDKIATAVEAAATPAE